MSDIPPPISIDPNTAINVTSNNDSPPLTSIDKLLIHSRLAPTGNGKLVDENPPSSGQKWFISLVFSILFFIVSNPFAYQMSSAVTTGLGGMPLADGGPNIVGLLVHSFIFGLIVRLLLECPTLIG